MEVLLYFLIIAASAVSKVANQTSDNFSEIYLVFQISAPEFDTSSPEFTTLVGEVEEGSLQELQQDFTQITTIEVLSTVTFLTDGLIYIIFVNRVYFDDDGGRRRRRRRRRRRDIASEALSNAPVNRCAKGWRQSGICNHSGRMQSFKSKRNILKKYSPVSSDPESNEFKTFKENIEEGLLTKLKEDFPAIGQMEVTVAKNTTFINENGTITIEMVPLYEFSEASRSIDLNDFENCVKSLKQSGYIEDVKVDGITEETTEETMDLAKAFDTSTSALIIQDEDLLEKITTIINDMVSAVETASKVSEE